MAKNQLENEHSAYLKSASRQPINWQPWSEEAFSEARKGDKPVLLDIGAVWCHWCHVMDGESYENPAVAEFINKNFVPIKVDRDERPDIDTNYQKAIQALTGQGGWPLTAFLTPDKEAYLGGTYFPPEDMYGMPSFSRMLELAAKAYGNDRASVTKAAKALMEATKGKKELQKAEELSKDDVQAAMDKILEGFDIYHGGFGPAPKFPMAEVLALLLEQHKLQKRQEYLNMVALTLKYMGNGGIYDQLGGGFHRYSTDAIWLIPHFEKMLTDNALLLKLYAQAYKITGNEELKRKDEHLANYLLKEMFNGKFFYASQDADTIDGEGAYYSWTEAELDGALGEDSKFYKAYYGVTKSGNFEQGKNILFVAKPLSELKTEFKLEEKAIIAKLNELNGKLLKVREKREKPFTDKTFYTGWNSLAASAMVEAYGAFKDDKFLEAAEKTLSFIKSAVYKDGEIHHSWDNGPRINGFLDDYAHYIAALLDYYAATLDYSYLGLAIEITGKTIGRFWDEDKGGFFFSASGEDKPILDHATPSPNSVMINNLIRVYHYTEEKGYLEKAEKALKLLLAEAARYPINSASCFSALSNFLDEPPKLVIAGEIGEKEVKGFLEKINSLFIPNLIVFLSGNPNRKLESIEGMEKMDDRAVVYVCTNKTCHLVKRPEELNNF